MQRLLDETNDDILISDKKNLNDSPSLIQKEIQDKRSSTKLAPLEVKPSLAELKMRKNIIPESTRYKTPQR